MSQKEAITNTTGSLLVLAGPGTGKTRVIIHKIHYLIELGLNPHKILAVTFSKKAAQEMKDRMLEIKPEWAEQVTVQTLHAFCFDLLERHAFRLTLGGPLQILSEAQARLLFREGSSHFPLQPFLNSSYLDPLMEKLLNFFQECKDEGLWPTDILSYANQYHELYPPTSPITKGGVFDKKIKEEWCALAEIYQAYQNYCFERGWIDFGDVLLLTLKLLQENPIIQQECHEKFEAILVDEFQDTNWIQIQILRAITAPRAHIMVVGDDDQAIYRFRGASYAAFSFFEEAFPHATTIELNETYRLTPEIAHAVTTLIQSDGQKRFKPQKKLISLQSNFRPVRVIQASSFEDEATWVIEDVTKLLKEGVPPSEIAVLVRAHSHAALLLEEAKRRHFPLEAPLTERLFKEEIVQDCLALFKLLQDPTDSISFLRLLDSPFVRLSAEDIYHLATKAPYPLLEALKQMHELPLSEPVKPMLSAFFKNYQHAFSLRPKKSASELLFFFYETSEIIAYLLQQNEADLKKLSRFHSELAEWEKAQTEKNFLSIFPLLESFLKHGTEESVALDGDKVPILTIHGSKGLEFDHVYILSLASRRFPTPFQKSTWDLPRELRREEPASPETHLQEERRLLYVAMTRARKELSLLTINKKGVKPSLFVEENLKKKIHDDRLLQYIELPSLETNQLMPPPREPFSRIQPHSSGMQKESPKGLRLSFTQLDTYETCPLAYRFRYDLKIPVRMPPPILVGLIVHEALEKFFRQIQEDQNPTEDNLIHHFETSFRCHQKDGPLSERDFQLGKEKLLAYYHFHDGKFSKPAAVEQPFNLKVGEHHLVGKIDRVDKTEVGYVIIDYKTGKAKSDENPADQKFAKESLQLSVYALAAEEVFHWNVAELVLYYLYENKKLTSTRTREDLDTTKHRILAIASHIQEKQFAPTPGRHCQWCEYQRICPAASYP